MIGRLICGLGVCLLARGPVAAQEPEQGERVLGFVPAGDLSAGDGPAGSVALPPFIERYGPDDPGALFDERGEMGVNRIADLASERFATAIDEGRLVIEVGSRQFRLHGRPVDVDAAAAWLRSMQAAVLERVRVDAWLVPVEDGTIGGETAAVFAADAPLSEELARWQSSAVVAANDLLVLHDTTRRPIVLDVTAGVAQGVSAATPEIGMVWEGVAVGIVVHPLAGSSDLVVSGQFANGRPRRDLRAEPTLAGMPSIEVPELNDHVNTFSARVPDGGGCVVWHGGDRAEGGREALLVRITRLAADVEPPVDVEVIPIGALSQTPLRRHWGGVNWADPDAPLFAFGEDTAPPLLPADEIVALVYQALGDAVDGPGVDVELADDLLLVRGKSAAGNVAREMVRRLEDELLVNASVVLRTATENGRLLHEVGFPTLLGRPCFAFRGTETIEIVGYHSKMAAGAKVLEPHVDHRYSGLFAMLVPVRSSSGGMHVDARVDLLLLEDLRRRSLEGEAGGTLSLAPTRHMTFVHSGPVPRQAPITFGSSRAIGGERVRQTVEIR